MTSLQGSDEEICFFLFYVYVEIIDTNCFPFI